MAFPRTKSSKIEALCHTECRELCDEALIPNAKPFGERPWTHEQIIHMSESLEQKLNENEMSFRAGPGGSKVPYLEAQQMINIANSVFGFGGWASSIISLSVDYVSGSGGNWNCGVSALVRVTLKDGCWHEDVGYGIANNLKGQGMAMEKAKKEAITDATKRAMRYFGNYLGNSIYDKGWTEEMRNEKFKLKKKDPPVAPSVAPPPPLAVPSQIQGHSKIIQTGNPMLQQTSNPMLQQSSNPMLQQTSNPMLQQTSNPMVSQPSNQTSEPKMEFANLPAKPILQNNPPPVQPADPNDLFDEELEFDDDDDLDTTEDSNSLPEKALETSAPQQKVSPSSVQPPMTPVSSGGLPSAQRPPQQFTPKPSGVGFRVSPPQRSSPPNTQSQRSSPQQQASPPVTRVNGSGAFPSQSLKPSPPFNPQPNRAVGRGASVALRGPPPKRD